MEFLPLRERNKQKVTQRIVTAAVELFKSRGYDQTTMDDIADAAEISRGTLFNYFPTKESLLLPWGQEILELNIRKPLEACLDTRPSTHQLLHFLFTKITENILTSPDVIRAFVGEAMKPANAVELRPAGTGCHEIFVDVLRYGQERGEVRTDIRVGDLARYLAALHAALLFRLMESPQPGVSSREIERMLAFLETGLSGPT